MSEAVEATDVEFLYMQLEQLRRIGKKDPKQVQAALDAALKQHPELRWRIVVGLYMDEKISLSKAAEMLDTDRWDLQNRFREQGIPLRFGPATLEELKQEIDNLDRLFGDVELRARQTGEAPGPKEQE